MTSSYTPSSDGALVAALEQLAALEPREWTSGEWERTNHADPPGPGWSARADDAVAGVQGVAEHWRYARGDGYPLAVGAPFYDVARGTDGARLYVVPNHDSAAHVGSPSGYRVTVLHRGRAYSAHPSLHMYRTGDEWNDWRPATDDDTSLEQRAGRYTSTLYGCDDMPAGAATKVRAAIVAAFREWATDHADELARARAGALSNAARSREEKAAKTARELLEILEQLRRIDNDDADAPTY